MSILSDAKIRALKPRAKAYKQSDYDGLYLLVNPSGSKLWRFKYRYLGKEKLLALGKYPEISLADARSQRDEARSLVANGTDPSQARKAAKAAEAERFEQTFEKIAEQLLIKKRREGRAPATIEKTIWLHQLLNADIGQLPITNITARDVLVPLKRAESKGTHETALRLRSAAGAVFRYAIALGIVDYDPTYALKDVLARPKAKHRAAITEPLGVGALLRSISGFEGQPTTRLALQLLSITAVRPGELRMAEWKEFELSERVWTIPEQRTKMRRPHKIPLPKQAMPILEELRRLNCTSRYVFPSIRTVDRCMSDNTLNGALRRLGYSKDEMTAHGFRAVFSTLANESGLWHPDAIERALAHVEKNEVRRAYARGQHWEERVRLQQWWADYLDELIFRRGAT